jgi:hypothetical protein
VKENEEMIKRWTIRSILILIFLLATFAWARSYWVGRSLLFHGKGHSERGLLSGGRFYFEHVQTEPRSFYGWESEWFTPDKWSDDSGFHFLGFTYDRAGHAWWFTIPLWFPSLVSGLTLFLAWRGTRKQCIGGGFQVEPASEEKELI